MSAGDFCLVHEWSEDQPFQRSHAHGQLFRKTRAGDSEDTRDVSATPPSVTMPLGYSFSAPVTKTDYIEKIRSFLNTKRSVFFHQDGDKFKFVNTQLGLKLNAVIQECRKTSQFFGRYSATFRGQKKLLLHMQCIRCNENREFFERPSTVFLQIKSTNRLSDWLKFCTVPAWFYHAWSFLRI